jgi:hypothetical protein
MLSKTSSSSSPGNGDCKKQREILVFSYFFPRQQLGYLADEHLENEDAEAPPVDSACVRRLGEHFRGEELGSAAEGAGAVAVTHALLAQAKVSDFHIALSVQQQVVQFEISATSQFQINFCFGQNSPIWVYLVFIPYFC